MATMPLYAVVPVGQLQGGILLTASSHRGWEASGKGPSAQGEVSEMRRWGVRGSDRAEGGVGEFSGPSLATRISGTVRGWPALPGDLGGVTKVCS